MRPQINVALTVFCTSSREKTLKTYLCKSLEKSRFHRAVLLMERAEIIAVLEVIAPQFFTLSKHLKNSHLNIYFMHLR